MERTIITGAIVLVLFGIIAYSIFLQRRGVVRQAGAIAKYDESLALARDSHGQLREIVALQREANRLLQVIAKEVSSLERRASRETTSRRTNGCS